MEQVLIIKGPHSGRVGHIIYSFYRHQKGFCQMEPIGGAGWERVFLVRSYF